ncbi:hypothetical protein NQ314_011760 [Rhamnusium bicolor]|uniref:PiggyBac transposable element-derived protein domain-containing protein n=1 Tax=Rhamnusium bicolor TaxID=1586634 RepID=A0AAV8XGI6_9CUCU|nr:hypothetical protein NQ314_011760 [Rhamnusium bicolor]
MDNFFTNVQALNKLRNKYQLTVICTLRKDKQQIPTELCVRRPKKTSMFAFEATCTMVSYIPKTNRNVFLLSSMHFNDNIDAETGKPEISTDYNKTKGSVDTLDKIYFLFSMSC